MYVRRRPDSSGFVGIGGDGNKHATPALPDPGARRRHMQLLMPESVCSSMILGNALAALSRRPSNFVVHLFQIRCGSPLRQGSTLKHDRPWMRGEGIGELTFF